MLDGSDASQKAGGKGAQAEKEAMDKRNLGKLSSGHGQHTVVQQQRPFPDAAGLLQMCVAMISVCERLAVLAQVQPSVAYSHGNIVNMYHAVTKYQVTRILS